MWNWALAQRTAAYRADGTQLNGIALSREFTQLRTAPNTAWLGDLPREPFNQVLRDQDRAFAAFFAKRARYPRFRRRGVPSGLRFTTDQRHQQVARGDDTSHWARVNLPGLGTLKLRRTEELAGRLRSNTLRRGGPARNPRLAHPRRNGYNAGMSLVTPGWARVQTSLDRACVEHLARQRALVLAGLALWREDADAAQRLFRRGLPIDTLLDLQDPHPVSGIDALIGAGIPPDRPAWTLLHVFAHLGQRFALDHLLSWGAQPAVRDRTGRDAAWIALDARHEPMAVDLARRRSVRPNLTLHAAPMTTRLMAAVQCSAADLVEALLFRHATVNAYDANGRTALHYNLFKTPYTETDRRIARLLRDAGASERFADNTGVTPAMLLARRDNADLLPERQPEPVTPAPDAVPTTAPVPKPAPAPSVPSAPTPHPRR